MRLQFSLRSIIAVLSVSCLLLVVLSYMLQPARFYSAEQITVLREGIHDDGIALRFSIPSESLYDCRGVNIRQSGDLIDVYFHRTSIADEHLNIQIPSELNDDGNCSVKIPFDIAAGKPVQLRLNGSKNIGRWEMAE